VLGTFEGLEIGGDLLFGFQAANVAFGLVVGERDTFDKSKSEPPGLMVDQSVKEVSAFGFFGLAPFALYGRWFFAVGQLADMPEFPLPTLPVGHQDGRFLTGSIQVEYELVHFDRPFGAFFDQVGQFAEQVGVAQGVLALPEAKIWYMAALAFTAVLSLKEQPQRSPMSCSIFSKGSL
jgi:hypothetical protein